MSNAADYLEDTLLDHVFGDDAYTAPATLYFGLSTTTIADDGTNVTEPSGGGYARVGKTNDLTNFPAASGGAKANGTVIDFGTATGAAWGTVTDWFIADAATAGNVLARGVLTASKTINDGDSASFAVGAFTLAMA
jgi:hypothetical protein